MKKIIIIIFLSLFIQIGFSMPINKVSLLKLVSNSEIIVFGSILKVEPIIDSNGLSCGEKATLKINEILKGQTKTNIIKIIVPGLTCPIPAQYKEGTTVLTFLNKLKDTTDYYITYGLSYGAKTMNNLSFQSYKKQIHELQNILQISNTTNKQQQILNWLIHCVKDKITRYECICELSPFREYRPYYENIDSLKYPYNLNKKQRTILRTVLFSIDTLSYEDLGLVDIALIDRDDSLINLLIKNLIFFKNKAEYNSLTEYLMARIVQLTSRKKLKQIIESIESIEYSEKGNKQKNKLVETFMENLNK